MRTPLLAFPLLLLPLTLCGNARAFDPIKSAPAAPEPNLVELKFSPEPRKSKPGVYYDLVWGVCSTGALQLMTTDNVRAFIAKTPDVSDCSPAQPVLGDGNAEYPTEMIQAGKSGSAHVLVRIGSNGRVEEAEAVCVSDRVFAPLAENAARSLRFEPARCGAERLVPVGSVILIPVFYDIEHHKTFLG